MKGQVERLQWGKALVTLTRAIWWSCRGRSRFELEMEVYHKDQVGWCIGRPCESHKGQRKQLISSNSTLVMLMVSLFFIFVLHLNFDPLVTHFSEKRGRKEGGMEERRKGGRERKNNDK